MIGFIVRRILSGLVVLFGVVLFVFVLARVIPGDPCVAAYGEKATPELCAQFSVRYGLDEPTGDGAVRISPDPARGRVQLDLARPGRDATVSVPRETVLAFLEQTEQAVPSGTERSEDAIDALLARLLGTEPLDS